MNMTRVAINGVDVAPSRVQDWERRRARAVLRRLRSRLGPHALAELDGLPEVTEDLDATRTALADLKLRLGHAGVYALFKRDLAISDRVTRAAVALSRGRTAHSITELTAAGVTAEQFTAWFTAMTTGDEAAMLRACPDHHLLRTLPDGRQEVLETTGGSPTANRFFIDYTDTTAIVIPRDPAYSHQLCGVARLHGGLAVGGVRHQFRDQDGMLHARLAVQFPAATPRSMVKAHRWHLACEFSNWIEACRADVSAPS